MRPPTLLLGALLVAVLAPASLAGCGQRAPAREPAATGATSTGARPPSPAGHPTAPAADPRVATALARMTVEEKVGQLFVATLPGLTIGAGGADLIRRYHVGGFIYFPANLRDAGQIAELSNDLQRTALAQRVPVPLMLAVDQEQGVVARLGSIITRYPGAMAVGATRDPDLAAGQAEDTGRELRALGINTDYAPVADVNTNPANPVIGLRSFGSDPGLVATMVRAQIEGFHRGGVAAVVKHFPGHGDTSVDSHSGLPVIRHTRQTWERLDAPPFRAAIAAGTDAVMTAHVRMPALDPAPDPATLSAPILSGLLRDRLGFRGVISTDSLRMAAVLAGRTEAAAAVRAVQAGADQVLMPADLGTAHAAVVKAVRTGAIPAGRLDGAVRRVLELKLRRGMFGAPLADPAAAAGRVVTAGHAAAARRLAERSVTLTANAGGLLPVGRRPVYVTGPVAAELAGQIRANGGRTTGNARRAEVVVTTTVNAWADPEQRRTVARWTAGRRPVVAVAVGQPYDLGVLPRIEASLATYSSGAPSLRAAARVITGRARPSGRLPVAVPGRHGGPTYPFGHGLGYR